MAVEGVMVSYNYSEDGELANILTVAASGIKFSKRWVLTHGSLLSPLKQVAAILNAKGKPILSDEFYDNLPEIHVTCEKGEAKAPGAYEEVERLSRQRNLDSDPDVEHSSYQIRVLTGRMLLELSRFCSASGMFAAARTDDFYAIIRKKAASLLCRVRASSNSILRTIAGRICHVWQCPILERCVADILYSWTVGHRDGDIEKQTPQLGKALLSVFVLVDLESDDRALKTLRPLSELFDLVRPPTGRGSTVEIQSTPFGCEVFLNAVTRGSVCGVVGKRPSLLLTDAATSLGSEGGPVFTEGPTKELIGIVVCSVSWWRGEWVGLTLAAPLGAVIASKLHVAPPLAPGPTVNSTHNDILDRIDKTTMLVRCGSAWGAGLYLGGGYVVTCAHVVKNYGIYKISLYCQGVRETAIVRYKTTDDKAYDLALLYTNPQYWSHLTPAVFAGEAAEKGESVLAAGYPYFNETNLDDLRPTVTSGHINNASPSMIQTSCCVQSGFSGGPIFRLSKTPSLVEVLGVIVSNAKTETGASYPYINMAVPTRAFIHLLHNFIQDKDETNLRVIENDKEMIQSQWRLMPYRSKI